MRRLREGNIRIVVLTLYLIDALAHHCGHALLLTFNDEQFMQQIASVARKYHLSPSQRAISMQENHPARAEAVSVCVELLNNWSEFFRARRAYYSNIVDMAEILESEGIGKPGNVRASSPSSPSVAASQGYTTLARYVKTVYLCLSGLYFSSRCLRTYSNISFIPFCLFVSHLPY